MTNLLTLFITLTYICTFELQAISDSELENKSTFQCISKLYGYKATIKNMVNDSDDLWAKVPDDIMDDYEKIQLSRMNEEISEQYYQDKIKLLCNKENGLSLYKYIESVDETKKYKEFKEEQQQYWKFYTSEKKYKADVVARSVTTLTFAGIGYGIGHFWVAPYLVQKVCHGRFYDKLALKHQRRFKTAVSVVGKLGTVILAAGLSWVISPKAINMLTAIYLEPA